MNDYYKYRVGANKGAFDYKNNSFGVEAKMKRIALGLTMEELGYDLCSVSYISKLENLVITPSQLYVKELAKRLEITDEESQLINRLMSVILDMTRHFSDEDTKVIDECFDKAKSLVNFRAQIVHLIYHLRHKDLATASIIKGRLDEVCKSLSNADVTLICLYSGILAYYSGELMKAEEYLYVIVKNINIADVKLLANLYLFKTRISLNRTSVLESYTFLNDYYCQKGDYTALANARYYLCLYFINNKDYRMLSDYIGGLRDEKLKSNIIFLVRTNLRTYLNFDDVKANLKPYYKALLKQPKNLNSFLDYYDIDYSLLRLEYLELTEIADKVKFINEIAIPNSCATKNFNDAKFFIKELRLLCIERCTYKIYVENMRKFEEAFF